LKPSKIKIVVTVLLLVAVALISYAIYMFYPWVDFLIQIDKNEDRKVEYLKILTVEKRRVAEQVFEFKDKTKTACIFIQDGIMAFSSSNHVLCIYDKKNRLIDKCVYGAHSLTVTNWTDDYIELEISQKKERDKKTQEYNEWYINSWKNRNRKIGKYHLKYHVRFEK